VQRWLWRLQQRLRLQLIAASDWILKNTTAGLRKESGRFFVGVLRDAERCIASGVFEAV
jgi:hypothetical protein